MTLDCDDPARDPPCWLKVTLRYDFRLLCAHRAPDTLTLRAIEHLRDDRSGHAVTARCAGLGRPQASAVSAAQALVEFALVAPIFFLLLFAIIEGGRFMMYYQTLNNATREGARYAIVHGSNSVRAQVVRCLRGNRATQLP